jgi:nicotinamide mononucleotide transporter
MTAIVEFLTQHALEILGFGVGILYVWWEYQANAKVWLASVVMPMISMWIYFNKGLYADFAINIYYLLIAVYGYVAWTFNLKKKEKAELPISRIPARTTLVLALAMAVLWIAMAQILINFTDSSVPWSDAFTTSLSIIAMWMLARKYAEQWLAWLVVDAVCVALYIYKGIYFYATLYAIYTVIAYVGYRKWLRLMQKQ